MLTEAAKKFFFSAMGREFTILVSWLRARVLRLSPREEILKGRTQAANFIFMIFIRERI